jgi:hypothetical protein
MRGTSVAVRIPRINSLRVSSNITQKNLILSTPSSIQKPSLKKELNPFILTPKSLVNICLTPKISRSLPKYNRESLNSKKTSLSSVFNKSFSRSFCLSTKNKPVSPKPLSKFDSYVRKQEMSKLIDIGRSLFPEGLNENIEYIPDPTYFRFAPLSEDSSTTNKIVTQSQEKTKTLKYLLNTNKRRKIIKSKCIKKNIITEGLRVL